MTRDPLWVGIRRHGTGWRATVSRGRDRPPIQQHFSRSTSPQAMQRWRADTKAALRLTRKQRATKGTFAHDARRYLRAVKAMPDYQTRTRDIARWVGIFGQRHRQDITPDEIRAWRDRWMSEPRSAHGWTAPRRPRTYDQKAKAPYAASTINHWLRALSNLWTVLDGKRAPNPVREVPEVPEPDALPRAIPYDVIERIIGAVSPRSRPVKGQPNKDTVSLTQIRLRVLAYTGLTYAQLRTLTPEDVDLAAGTMLVRRRQKGRGVQPRRLPLLPEAVDAFRALDAAQGWGHFSGASVRKTFLVAAGKVRRQMAREGQTLPPIRPNDLRHSMATLVYLATTDLGAVSELLQHGSVRTTRRYALAGVSAVLHAQLAKVRTWSSHSVEPDGNS